MRILYSFYSYENHNTALRSCLRSYDASVARSSSYAFNAQRHIITLDSKPVVRKCYCSEGELAKTLAKPIPHLITNKDAMAHLFQPRFLRSCVSDLETGRGVTVPTNQLVSDRLAARSVSAIRLHHSVMGSNCFATGTHVSDLRQWAEDRYFNLVRNAAERSLGASSRGYKTHPIMVVLFQNQLYWYSASYDVCLFTPSPCEVILSGSSAMVAPVIMHVEPFGPYDGTWLDVAIDGDHRATPASSIESYFMHALADIYQLSPGWRSSKVVAHGLKTDPPSIDSVSIDKLVGTARDRDVPSFFERLGTGTSLLFSTLGLSYDFVVDLGSAEGIVNKTGLQLQSSGRLITLNDLRDLSPVRFTAPSSAMDSEESFYNGYTQLSAATKRARNMADASNDVFDIFQSDSCHSNRSTARIDSHQTSSPDAHLAYSSNLYNSETGLPSLGVASSPHQHHTQLTSGRRPSLGIRDSGNASFADPYVSGRAARGVYSSDRHADVQTSIIDNSHNVKSVDVTRSSNAQSDPFNVML